MKSTSLASESSNVRAFPEEELLHLVPQDRHRGRVWVWLKGQSQGPYDVAELRRLPAFTLSTKVRIGEGDAWRAAFEVIDLKTYFAPKTQPSRAVPLETIPPVPRPVLPPEVVEPPPSDYTLSWAALLIGLHVGLYTSLFAGGAWWVRTHGWPVQATAVITQVETAYHAARQDLRQKLPFLK